MDKDNTGLVPAAPATRTSRKFDCTDPTRDGPALREGLRGLPRHRTAAPLPQHYLSKFPIKDQVAGKGFRPDEMPNIPVSGAFKYEVGHAGPGARPRQQPRTTRASSTGKPAHLDELILKWYGDADAMIAGYKGGEVDFATDLHDADLPKVTGPGRPGRSRPGSLTYEFLRPNWNPRQSARRTPPVAGPRHGLPDVRPGDARGDPLRDRQGRDQHPAPGRHRRPGANTNISPERLVLRDQPPAPSIPRRPSRSSTRPAGPSAPTGSARRTASRPRSSSARRPARSARTPSPSSSSWLKDVGIDGGPRTPCPPTDIFADYNEATDQTPCALSQVATSTSPSTPSRCSLDPLATTPATTAASSSRTAATTPR